MRSPQNGNFLPTLLSHYITDKYIHIHYMHLRYAALCFNICVHCEIHLKKWLTQLWSWESLESVRLLQAENPGRIWCCRLEAEFIIPGKPQPLLTSLLTDWMRPTQTIQVTHSLLIGHSYKPSRQPLLLLLLLLSCFSCVQLCAWDFPGKSTGVGCHLLRRQPLD